MKVISVTNNHGSRRHVKMWEPEGFPFEKEAMDQIENIARMPFIHKHVAVMPDAHAGKGATVGTVIATKGAIIPAAVGVDIGCGMMAMRLSLKADQLPDTLSHVRGMIEAAVPHGRTDNGGANDRGAWGDVPDRVLRKFRYSAPGKSVGTSLSYRLQMLGEKHEKLKRSIERAPRHLGSLGTGNHFIELCIDEADHVWVMLHSGSRGIGNAIGSYFIEQAKREMERYHIAPYLPDSDLSYLVEHTQVYDDYVEAVEWAQEFAMANREVMMASVMEVLQRVLPSFRVINHAVNCHHNYVTQEQHFGENVWVTRKGAVQAREGTLGIIPGSMGTGSFIVEGLGNKDSFCSCSHGAGRVMSRTKAKQMITLDQHAEAMKGIEARLDADILDESPAAYKDIGAVMAAQDDLVRIRHRLHQVLNVKG